MALCSRDRLCLSSFHTMRQPYVLDPRRPTSCAACRGKLRPLTLEFGSGLKTPRPPVFVAQADIVRSVQGKLKEELEKVAINRQTEEKGLKQHRRELDEQHKALRKLAAERRSLGASNIVSRASTANISWLHLGQVSSGRVAHERCSYLFGGISGPNVLHVCLS